MSKISAPVANNLDKCTKDFIQAVQEKGLEHVFCWIDQWYARAAQAAIEDRAIELGAPAMPALSSEKTFYEDLQMLRSAACLDVIASNTSSAFNYGTGQGSNMWRAASLSAAASLLGQDPGYSLRSHRDAHQEKLRQRYQELKPQASAK